MASINSNSNLAYANPELWADALQREFYKKKVYPVTTRLTVKDILSIGDTVNRQIMNDVDTITLTSSTANTSITDQSLTLTNEQLTIGYDISCSFNIDDINTLQNQPELFTEAVERYSHRLGNYIDAVVLGEVDQAGTDFDNYDLGATEGDPAEVNESNIRKVFTSVHKKLDKKNIPEDDRIAVISPDIKEIIVNSLGGREDALGVETVIHGASGKFGNMNLYISNNLPFVTVVSMATNPSDGDTFVYNGVTFTFVDTLGTTAGNIHITSTVDKTRANLATYMEAPDIAVASATDAGFVPVSSADQKKLQDLTATNDDDNDILTIRQLGKSYVVSSETFSEGTDSITKKYVECYFGRRGGIDLAIQKQPSTEIERVQSAFADRVKMRTIFGVKVFSDGAETFTNVKIDASEFTS